MSEHDEAQKVGGAWDLTAVALSMLCVAHCIGMPFFISVLPFLGVFSDDHVVHVVLVLCAVPVTLWVVWQARQEAGSGVFMGAALAGLGLLVIAVSVHALEDFEVPLTLVGGTLLAGAHFWRWQQNTKRAHHA